MDEEEVYVCQSNNKITGYECVDEKECRQARNSHEDMEPELEETTPPNHGLQEQFGISEDKLRHLGNEVLYRDGGNQIYYHEDTDTFYQQNNLSHRWSRISDHDRYYNKYLVTS
jgi:hypothetical protein